MRNEYDESVVEELVEPVDEKRFDDLPICYFQPTPSQLFSKRKDKKEIDPEAIRSSLESIGC